MTSFAHDLLLALLGNWGDVFVLLPDVAHGADSPALAPNLPLLGVHERALLEAQLAPVLPLGAQYSALRSFVLRYEHSKSGLYINALALGISDVLCKYRAAVVRAEADVLAAAESDFAPPISRVCRTIVADESSGLLEPLCQLIRDVQRGALRGGRLLTAL